MRDLARWCRIGVDIYVDDIVLPLVDSERSESTRLGHIAVAAGEDLIVDIEQNSRC